MGRQTLKINKNNKGVIKAQIYSEKNKIKKEGIKASLMIIEDVSKIPIKKKKKDKIGETPKRDNLLIQKKGFIDFLSNYRGIINFFDKVISNELSLVQKKIDHLLDSLPSGQKIKEVFGMNYLLNEEDNKKYKELDIQEEIISSSKYLLPESFLITLISKYEHFFSNLLKIIYKEYPKKIQKKMEISFELLDKWDKIDDIKKDIIEESIESIMYSSTKEQINTFLCLIDKKKKEVASDPVFGKDLIFKEFVKITLDRNIIVHCNGNISEKYLDDCKKNEIDCKKLAGSRISIDNKYLIKSCDIVYYMTIKLFYLIWTKCYNKNEEIDILYQVLNEDIFDLLINRNFSLAKNISEFVIKTIKDKNIKITNEDRMLIIINHALAYKMDGDNEKCLQIIDKEDRSGLDDKFKFANLILHGEWKKASTVMDLVVSRQGKKGKIGEKELQDWPLFFEFKNQQEFLLKYKKIFKKDFIEKIEKDYTK